MNNNIEKINIKGCYDCPLIEETLNGITSIYTCTHPKTRGNLKSGYGMHEHALSLYNKSVPDICPLKDKSLLLRFVKPD